MQAIRFTTEGAPARVPPARMDVALVLGFLAERPGAAADPAIATWLRTLTGDRSAPDSLLNLPLPLESIDEAERLFVLERPVGRDGITTPVAATTAAALRAFFSTGGRRCVFVDLGAPPPVFADTGQRLDALHRLLIGPRAPAFWSTLTRAQLGDLVLPDLPPPGRGSGDAWGLGWLSGLDEVAHLMLPDLAELVAAPPETLAPRPHPPLVPPERFVICADEQPAPAPEQVASRIPLARTDDPGLGLWRRVIGSLLGWLQRHAPDRMLLAAPPNLASPGTCADDLLEGPTAEAAIRLQLIQPWIGLPGQLDVAGGLMPGEAVLAGLLADNALHQGAFRSSAGSALPAGTRLGPILADPDRRSSLFARHVRGLRLAIDHTAGTDPRWQPASVRRLTNLLLRSARSVGWAALFEPASERLWREIEDRLRLLLAEVFEAGGLRGGRATEAYDVRCDRSTMSQNDIDSGRVIARVGFLPALPVARIEVALPIAGAVR